MRRILVMDPIQDPLVITSLRIERLSRQAEAMDVELQFVSLESAQEGDWVEQMQLSMQQNLGVILHPPEALLGSVALRDAIEAIPLPVVLVWFDHATPELSLLGAVCHGTTAGFGEFGLSVALDALMEMTREEGKV